MKNIPVSEFLNEIKGGIVIDVRTPAEYEKGHIVGACNMPLFTNEERAVVGTIYVRQGKELAVEKGLDFVGARLSNFIRETKKIIKQNDGDEKTPLYLYCWRGGMRSNSLAWLLSTAGFNVKVLLGGYKAYRRYFLSKLNVGYWSFTILGGPTGCGKTDILQSLTEKGQQVLDLEGHAKHRGSAFGVYGYEEPQPSSEHFGNRIFDQLARFDSSRTIWCEGESMSIGKVFMPQELYNLIQRSNFIYFSIPRAIRLDHIVRDYGECPKEVLIQSFTNITKRLGHDNAKRAIELVNNGDLRSAADIALVYYDKGYNLCIESRAGKIIQRIEMEGDTPDLTADELIKLIEYEDNRCKR